MLRSFLNFFIDVYQFIVDKASACFAPSPSEAKTMVPEDKTQNITVDINKDKKETRRVFPYKKNVSAALQLPISENKLSRLQSDPATILHMCNEYILEHSQRRADIYFYLLVALYNTHTKLKQGHTILQHGKGRKSTTRQNLTNACHSSLFPNLIDNQNRNIFADLHLQDTMNSTVELPIFVNQLDSELEGKIHQPSIFRKKSLDILQKVADGQQDPIQGFRQFLKIANENLASLGNNDRKNNAYLLRKSGPLKEIKLQLLQIVKSGTACDEEKKFKEYVNLLLRLTPPEIIKSRKSIVNEKKIHLEKIYSIQKEIFASKSLVAKRKIS